MTKDKVQNSRKTCRAVGLAKAEERRDREKGPRMDTNPREDKPQMSQPSSGRRQADAGLWRASCRFTRIRHGEPQQGRRERQNKKTPSYSLLLITDLLITNVFDQSPITNHLSPFTFHCPMSPLRHTIRLLLKSSGFTIRLAPRF